MVEKAKVEREEMKAFQGLVKGLEFFLNREVPRESLAFIIRSFGGQVSWDKTLHIGATYPESDETITHHVADRPSMEKQYLSRYFTHYCFVNVMHPCFLQVLYSAPVGV